MNFQRWREREPLEINLVPLIDVMMVILIFLMITTTYNRYTELAINLPSADAQKQPERANEISVLVDAQGQYVINRRAVVFRTVDQLADEPHRGPARRRAAPGGRRRQGTDGGDQRRCECHSPGRDSRHGGGAQRGPVADHLHGAVRKVVRYWYRRGLLAWLLWPLSVGFRLLVVLRRLLYWLRVLPS